MTSRYRRTYPEKEVLLFDGGMNNKFERSIIADNESPDWLNVICSNGAVETRPGTSKLNTAAIGSFVGDGLYVRRANTGTETMVAFAGGSMWQLVGTSFTTVPSAVSVFTASSRVGAEQDENYLFCGNGGTIPYKWNGAEFTRHGVYPPTTTATVASQATGVLTGDYRYKVTAVNSNLVESDVGPATATLTAGSATIRVSSIPTFAASFGVNARRLYRTEAGGTSFKRVATIADNTTTTYDDNTADAALGTAAPTDNGVPPNYSAIIYHQGRLFMNDPANPHYVRWTDLGQPYTVASTNFKIVGNNTSDLVKGFAVHGNDLVVLHENGFTIAYMGDTDASTWRWVVSKSAFGSKSPYGAVRVGNRILFPAFQNTKFVGFGEISGETIVPSTTLLTTQVAGSQLVSDPIEPDMLNEVQDAYAGNISAIVYENQAYIALTYGSGQTTNNRYYLYDFEATNASRKQRRAWIPNTGLNIAQFAVYSGKLYYLSSTATGFVYQMGAAGYTDDGAAINSYAWTKEFTGYKNESEDQKDFRWADLMVENVGDYAMDVGYRVNSDTGSGDVKQINLNPGGSLWGTMMWGRDPWGGGTSQREYRLFLGNARGKRIQFKFSNRNTAGQRFKIHWMKNFTYNIKGSR